MYNVYYIYIVHEVECGETWVALSVRKREVAYLLFIFCNQSIISNQLPQKTKNRQKLSAAPSQTSKSKENIFFSLDGV